MLIRARYSSTSPWHSSHAPNAYIMQFGAAGCPPWRALAPWMARSYTWQSAREMWVQIRAAAKTGVPAKRRHRKPPARNNNRFQPDSHLRWNLTSTFLPAWRWPSAAGSPAYQVAVLDRILGPAAPELPGRYRTGHLGHCQALA